MPTRPSKQDVTVKTVPEDDVEEMELPDKQGIDTNNVGDDEPNPNIDRKTVLEFASDSTGKLADLDTG